VAVTGISGAGGRSPLERHVRGLGCSGERDLRRGGAGRGILLPAGGSQQGPGKRQDGPMRAMRKPSGAESRAGGLTPGACTLDSCGSSKWKFR